MNTKAIQSLVLRNRNKAAMAGLCDSAKVAHICGTARGAVRLMNLEESRDIADVQCHHLAACFSLQNLSGRDRRGWEGGRVGQPCQRLFPQDFCLAKDDYEITINEKVSSIIPPSPAGILEILLKMLAQAHSWCYFTTPNGGRAAAAETNLLCPKPGANKVYRVSYYMDLAVRTNVLTL